MENEKLEIVKNEVIEIHNKILKTCEENGKLKKIYKGCIIYLSPLYKNPDVLYFGINPGDGYFRRENKIMQEFDPQETDKHSGYGIWLEFEDCCTKINKKYLLKSTVKSNRYFFATHNVRNLDKFFDLLPQEFHWEIARKQENWIKTIVYELSPKIIICGGQTAYEKFISLYPDHEYLEGSKDNHVIKINGIHLLSFKRRIDGKMKNKEDFIEYLRKYTQNIVEI